ncbi:transcription initiation factor TFIID subunit 2 isoform X1 [Sesamum indicum]|uniref:Transcription initiation factor TFIID subunit 2 n=1 Tax=Sesamum indicum TaxID=4182 RepID=A0A6I9U9I0_SESIN|nr:transcription initiation factor TFIID subunit 2 isoform X1 [Sesamum indicum]XP_011094292.1 transcription initiation factor TFIID subunit 2 isoform X1 [Sesamum indicum]
MAKAKKAKNEEQRGGDNSNSEAVVKHQKLCLSIDMDNQRVYGYTELQIVIPDNGIVGLHADNLAIEKVTVDGEPAEFEVFPHYQHLDPKDRWCVVSSATSAADASGSVYLSSLEIELLPNLLIMCSKSSKTDKKQEENQQIDNGEPLSAVASRWVQNVKSVRIEYWVDKAETGIHFNDNVLHTDNQLRRARCWFPCMDDSLQCCCYDLEFTVASNLVAVSSGTLLHQVLTNDDPPRKTYVYKLDVPVAAQCISLAVASFEILPDRHGGLVSHFCLPANLSKLRNTVVFFYNAFSHYEDYLSASFPFGSYKQVFIAPGMTVSSWNLGASIGIFSSHLLFDEKLIDQTIETRIKLAYALARQWFGVYITPEAPNDEWLLDGLAGFLTDSFIKRFLGNNEARYRRYKANCAVCQADDSGATALSSTLASKDLYGTQSIGFYGKIRSWKSVAVLQMLEKQMGPESFRKILQNIVLRARDGNRSLRTLSTKEFRHFANKIGNLERPFLKEFFPRWVGSCGCPVLKMGFSYNKRKNMVELAVLRGCTSRPDSWVGVDNINPDSENRENGIGWPGMMSIRVHELDGMYDHPILSMAGEPWQLLEIQCHSKLAAKRFQKPKKGVKADGSDDNGDAVATTDVRLNSDSPLLWLRADPEMEYLAEVNFNQPVQMWINQLEKDKDVVAQAQAIAVLEALPQLSFSVVNALNNFLSDSKAFWRVRIQAAYALATTACEETDWAGLLHLINFYKSRRFDPNIGLPRPNDFHDFQEYFVLEAIPHAIAMVRSSDKKSPREAVEFILQLLKYNDNNGNTYSDVFWLAALVQSVGELEFGQQSIIYLPSLLKRLDRLLQFDRLMPSHNGILTISCIQSLTQMALKLSEFIPLDSVIELIEPYRMSKMWQIRVAASRALLELEFQCKGTDAALTMFIRYLSEESSLRGQSKLGVCALRLAQMTSRSDCDNDVKSDTLVALLRLLESPLAFNNVILRHHIFCILQVLAGRAPTLYGVPRDETLRMGHTKTCSELKNIFAALIKQSKTPEPSSCAPDFPHNLLAPEGYMEGDGFLQNHESTKAVTMPAPDALLISAAQQGADAPDDGPEQRNLVSHPPGDDPTTIPKVQMPAEVHEPIEQVTNFPGDTSIDAEYSRKADTMSDIRQEKRPVIDLIHDSLVTGEAPNEPDTVSNSRELKKPKLKIRVKQSAASSRAEDPDKASSRAGDRDNPRILNAQDGHNDVDRGASSSVSVDAPHRTFAETISTGNQNFEDANSCQDVGSRVTASIGSAKPTLDGEELVKELQCTADSSKISLPLPPADRLPTSTMKINNEPQSSEQYLASRGIRRHDVEGSSGPTDPQFYGKEKEKKKDKDRKRKKNGHHDDPEHKELKRQKKEKKRKEKEMAKLLADKPNTVPPSLELPSQERRIGAANNLDAKPTVVESGSKQVSGTRQDMVRGEGATSSSKELHKLHSTSGINVGSVQPKPAEPVEANVVVNRTDGSVNVPQSATSHKIKIKFKNRTLGKK